jgi:hypothetical protein
VFKRREPLLEARSFVPNCRSGLAAALVAYRLRGLLAEYSELPVARRARQIDHI